jgi:uncharacterized metal-binding protein YceD (DUF177 family)
VTAPFSRIIKLHEVARGPVRVQLAADADQRAQIAKLLKLESLPAFTVDITVKPWLDGAEIVGAFKAVVEQVCSVSLDNFEQPLSGQIELRLVPRGSPHAAEEDAAEVEYDLAAPDPPDILDSDDIDVAAYAVEALALEIDPFPRKPGAEFEFEPPPEEESPFAILKALKDREP